MTTGNKSGLSPGPDGRPYDQQPRWRQDFPIDTAQDNYVARRDFTKFMILTSGAFVVGQLWIALHNQFRKRRGKPSEKAIAAVRDVAVGSSLGFRYPDSQLCLLIRPDQDTFLAYGNKCTHLHCPVRPVLPESKLQCPCHNGYFDLHTGRPLAGPPRLPLPRISLEIRGGVLYATGVELRT